MYNEKLETLINAALADGVLTEKEKEVLFKNAASMGIDHDEFEMYLEGRRAKRKEEINNLKIEKANAKEAFSSIQDLAEKIDYISRYGHDIDDIDGKNTLEINQAKDANNEDIINTIAMFPVPNTTNGILEFLALACSKAKYRGGLWGTITGRMKMYVAITLIITLIGVIVGLIIDREEVWMLVFLAPICFLMVGGIAFFVQNKDIIRYNKVAEAWHDKFEQVILKGRSLRGDEAFTQQLNYYESQLKN